MWIRTQSKLRLIKCDNIVIRMGVGLFSDKYTIENVADEYEIILGAYSTEEKAIKVLDALQKYIGGKTKLYITQDNGNPNGYHILDNLNIPMGYCKDGIFIMPLDKEVE